MHRITKTVLKREVLKRFDAELKPKGYKRISDGGIQYCITLGVASAAHILIFYNTGEVTCSCVYSCQQEVEQYMKMLIDEKYPNQIQAKYPLTFRHARERARFNVNKEGLENLEGFVSSCLHYINEESPRFVEHYTYLPNILTRMDELVEIGLTWQHPKEGILYGSLDAFFRGLIISKLCNDSQFDSKVEFCDKYLYDGTNDEWVPYYEKLKAEILPTIEPKYNI